MKYTNIYYFYYLNVIGGTETFLYQLAQKYGKYDLTVIYNYADPIQVERLSKYVRCIQFKGQEIECERAFFNYGTGIIEHVHAKEYCLVIHGDYEELKKTNPAFKVELHPKLNRFIAVSKRAADSFTRVTGKKCEVSYNPITPVKPKKLLNLVSATRLTKEKGKNRMIKLAEMLDKAGIHYIWTIFTNDTDAIDNPNVIYMKPRLDITDYIANADYLVQLSDNEGYCYSVIEALCAGTPVIVTPCPVFDELGIIDGKHGYRIPFDMNNFDVNVLLDKPVKVEYQPPQDNWDNILIHTPSTWMEEKRTLYTVKALDTYQKHKLMDGELNKIPEQGYTWKVTPARMRVLTGDNERGLHFVRVIKKEVLDK